MTERNTSNERLSERDVERLLQQFFAGEVPADWRQEETPAMLSQPQLSPMVRTANSDASRSLAGILGILVSASCCLIVTLFVPGEPLDEINTASSPTTGENHRHEPNDDKPLPIEERSHLPFTSTGNHTESLDSETKSTDPLGPELEIEIFPLRPDKPGE